MGTINGEPYKEYLQALKGDSEDSEDLNFSWLLSQYIL
jgi:hypothetical protein